jgi:histidine triad (HIT) family protein
VTDSCLFCRIVSRDIPADIVYETDTVIAFRDIGPQAPVHILVIPKRHIPSLAQAGTEDGRVLGEVLLGVREVSEREGLAEAGFRTVLNTGDDGGQTVHHLHAHVLGGRPLSWPPG